MPLFRQLFDPASATLTYLVADPVTRAAALIDPVAAHIDAVRALLGRLGLSLRYVLRTHARPGGTDTLPALRAATGTRAGDLAGPQADAGTLHDSVHARLFRLPDEYLVYPGHDRHGRRVSCIAQEKLTNADLRLSRDAFVAAMRSPAAAQP